MAGNEVDRWTEVHPPWKVVEDAAPLLRIHSRPNLNRLICRFRWLASYDQDPCKVSILQDINTNDLLSLPVVGPDSEAVVVVHRSKEGAALGPPTA